MLGTPPYRWYRPYSARKFCAEPPTSAAEARSQRVCGAISAGAENAAPARRCPSGRSSADTSSVRSSPQSRTSLSAMTRSSSRLAAQPASSCATLRLWVAPGAVTRTVALPGAASRHAARAIP